MSNRLHNVVDGAGTVFEMWPGYTPPRRPLRRLRTNEARTLYRAWAKVGLWLTHACEEHIAELPEDERARVRTILSETEERAIEAERTSRLFGERRTREGFFDRRLLFNARAESFKSAAD